jgi:hypothetical protein
MNTETKKLANLELGIWQQISMQSFVGNQESES